MKETSEFRKACSGVNSEKLLEVMDEFMYELKILHPKKYWDVLKQIHACCVTGDEQNNNERKGQTIVRVMSDMALKNS